MDRVSGKLTIYFEDPFWVGVFERIENRKLSVAKVTFGVEPKDYDVLEFINRNYTSNRSRLLSVGTMFGVWVLQSEHGGKI